MKHVHETGLNRLLGNDGRHAKIWNEYLCKKINHNWRKTIFYNSALRIAISFVHQSKMKNKMFTLEQIKEAHLSTVKTGADFPKYVKRIIELGVSSYETFVADGHTAYYSKDKQVLKSERRYDTIKIVNNADKEAFAIALKKHQQGQTTFPDFCNDCAINGVEKWIVDTNKMTCAYYDLQGNKMLEEIIPRV
ncbi:MAG: DUF1398 family protein [Chitinophagaceae bacterium]